MYDTNVVCLYHTGHMYVVVVVALIPDTMAFSLFACLRCSTPDTDRPNSTRPAYVASCHMSRTMPPPPLSHFPAYYTGINMHIKSAVTY